MRLLAALCLVDTVTPWAPHAAQRWARHSARSANPQDVETARSADIVAVAESFGIDVNARNKACCPFHDERTPSFTLNPDKGLYKCFGCGAGGDVIKLYRELANATFAEAVEALVKEDRPKTRRVAEDKPEVDASERIQLKQANAVAQEVYAEALRHQTSGGARQYLRKRGINAKTAAAFGLGFARPGTARSLTKDIDKEAFVAAGVLYQDGRARFGSKITFPIRDACGDTLGFGSRALKIRKDEAKYVNSPASAVFSKGSCLFGLDVAKDAIKSTDEALLVEGYFDVLALHDAGCANAVGVLGVGVTPRQLETAARFSPSRRVVLALDADAAGDAAVRRLCDDVLPTLADESGVDVVVMRWPDGAKDAADFVEGRRLRGETDAAIASAVRDLCAAATAWNDVDVCDIPINEADAASSSAPPPSPDADETSGQDDLRRKIDELQKQLAELSAQVAGS